MTAREWKPAVDETVVDRRPDTAGQTGTVTRVDHYGHFADPWWLAVVRWDSGGVESDINTVWLTRPDGPQGVAK